VARTPASGLSGLTTKVGGLWIFAIPFAAIGTLLVFSTLRTLLLLAAMQGWTVVPGTLQTAELTASGQASNRADATYTYVFEGRMYSGHRVSLYGADNLGSFQKDTYEDLNEHLQAHQPYPVHVNPKAPEQSILKPVLRVETIAFSLVFILLFGGAGWGILISSFLRMKKAQKEKQLMAQYPQESWKWRVEWTAAGIKSTQGAQAVMQICLAVFWNVATFPVFLIIPKELRDGHYGVLAALVIPLIGVGLAFWAVVAAARAQRFGQTRLQLETMPGRPGQTLRGRLYAPQALEAAEFASITLRCETTATNPNANGQDPDGDQSLWVGGASVPVLKGQATNGDVVMDVAIDIPPGLPDSFWGKGDQYAWLLTATAPLRGADFAVEMEIPVFSA
jgi:hypothetical protein